MGIGAQTDTSRRHKFAPSRQGGAPIHSEESAAPCLQPGAEIQHHWLLPCKDGRVCTACSVQMSPNDEIKHREQKYAQVVAQSMEGVFALTDSEHHLGDKCFSFATDCIISI